MLGFFAEYKVSLLASLALHATVFGILLVSIVGHSLPPPASPQLTIQAAVVDENRIQQEIDALEEAERAEQADAQKKLDEARRRREAEEKKAQDAQDKRRQEELREKQRVMVEKREREQAEAKAAKELEELQRKTRAEEQRLAKIKAEQDAAEKKKREAEAARKKAEEEADARRKAQLEAQLREELNAEQNRLNAVKAGLLDQYRALIQQKVRRNWIRPPSAGAGVRCELHINQIPGGEVISVRIGDCNGDEATRRSIEAAVKKASPLPEPPDPALFERNLILIFQPEN